MKKIISLIAALAMVSSLFVTISYAAPASMTLVVDVAAADADQIAEYEDNIDSVPEGYTLYALTISQTGLGDWENTNTATSSAQKKKPTGFLPAGLSIVMDFDSDIANIYEDKENGFYVASEYGFGVAVNGSEVVMTYGPWTTAAPYPLNASGETTIAEGDPIAVLYLAASAQSTATFTDQTVFSMKQLSAGTTTESAEYSTAEGNITFPASIVLGAAPAPTTYTYTFKNADGTDDIDVQSGLAAGAAVTAPTAPTVAGKVFDHWATSVGGAAVTVDTTASADTTYYAVYVDAAPAYETVAPSTAQTAKVAKPGAAAYTNYSGDSVTLSKNYAIARFQTDIDGSKKYQIHASSASTATEKDFDVNFGLLEVSGTANFVTIIKGAPADTVMELRVK